MKKKGKASSSMERKKNNKIPINTNNNQKEKQSKLKQPLNKSVEKKRKVGLNIVAEPIMNNTTIEAKSQKDKIHLTRQRKDKTGSQKAVNSRSAKTNKTKEYENTLNKLTEDNDYEKEKDIEKEYDFFNFKANNDNSTNKIKEKDKNKLKSKNYNDEDNSKRKKNNAKSVKSVNIKEDKNKKKVKNKIYDNNNEDYSDEEEKEKKDDFIHRALYRTSLDDKGLNNEKYKTLNNQDKSKDKKRKEIERNNELSNNQYNEKFIVSMEKTDDIRYSIGDKKIYSNISNDKQKKL